VARLGRAVVAVVALALFAAPAALARDGYSVTIKRTQYGIPHITGKTFGDVGYGYGYSFAKDNICTMADQYVTVRAERTKTFGADKTYVQRGNGTTVNNLDSDFFWKRIIDDKVVEKLLDRQPPFGPRPDVRAIVRGYVAGWNRYLAHVGGPDGISDPNCKGKSWVTPITEIDAYRRFYQLILIASQGVAIDGISQAAPAGDNLASPVAAADAQTLATGLKEIFPKGGIGSNAVAIGRDGMKDRKHGLVLGNPMAKITLTEYIDTSCPICKDYVLTTFPSMVTAFVRPGKVKVEARALAFVGPSSTRGRQLLLAAARQDKGWQFAELVYHNQGDETTAWLTDDIARALAAKVPGLSVDTLFADASSAKIQTEATKADSQAQADSVSGTPTFVLTTRDGKRHLLGAGNPGFSAFAKVLNRALKG